LALRDIAVFIDSAAESDGRLRFAALLAQTHKARLTGIFVVTDSGTYRAYVRGKCAIRSMIENWFVPEQRKVVLNGKKFTEFAARFGLLSNFRVVWSDSDRNRRIVLESLSVDLIVIGQHAPHGLPDGWHPETLFAACSVPVLVAPAGWTGNAAAGRIAIAWNASKEARRAVSDAMPLLASAQSVSIISVDQEDDQPGIDVARHLSRHGVRAKVEASNSDGQTVADAILSAATLHGADLIVIGAYGHARSTRTLFGSVTHSILLQTSIPVFMSK